MSIRIDRVVTRGGDSGQTSLGDGSRVSKHTVRVGVIGSLDELNAAVGLLRAYVPDESPVSQTLMQIQHLLFDMGADICCPEATKKAERAARITEELLLWVEQETFALQERLAPLTSFVLPGGSIAAAWAHMVRTQVRRTERDFVTLMQEEEVNKKILKILNRLSDYFFVLARHFNDDGKKDILWKIK